MGCQLDQTFCSKSPDPGFPSQRVGSGDEAMVQTVIDLEGIKSKAMAKSSLVDQLLHKRGGYLQSDAPHHF